MIEVEVVELATEPVGLLAFLAATEIDRAAAMATDDLRRRYVVLHATLRQGLAARLGAVDPAAIEIAIGEHGKPYLVGRELEFNLSDSEDIGLVAFSDEGPVGVDVEHIRPVEHERLARRFFSMLECAALEDADDPALAFFTIWTRKEAVVKATGRGISGGLSAFTVDCGPAGHAAAGCWIEPFEAPSGFVAAVAVVR